MPTTDTSPATEYAPDDYLLKTDPTADWPMLVRQIEELEEMIADAHHAADADFMHHATDLQNRLAETRERLASLTE